MQQIVKDTLIVGQTFKNYKMLCQTLKQIPKKGDSKKSQVKEFKRYFDWEQQGQKLTITEIYDTPKEKIDNRVNNRGHKKRQIPLELIECGLYWISQKDVTIITPFDIFLQLGLCNDETSQILYNKDDLLYNKDSPFKECDYIVIDIVMNNLYNSMKRKVMCNYVKECKLIIYYDENDNYCSRLATDEEMTIIKQVEQDVLNTYNERHDTTFEKFSDIYTKGTNRQKMSITTMKRNRLENELTDYNKDMSCLVLDKSIQNITPLYDYEQTKQQINTLFYEGERNRIITHYDKQIEKITTSDKRCYGNVKTHKIKQLEENKEYSLKLLEYVLKLDKKSNKI